MCHFLVPHEKVMIWHANFDFYDDLNFIVIKLFGIVNGHVRNSQLKIVPWPVLQRRSAFGAFVVDEKESKQDAGRISGDENENMPKTVQIWEVHRRPGVAEHAIVNPAHDGSYQDRRVTNTQTVHALIFDNFQFLIQKVRCWYGQKH